MVFGFFIVSSPAFAYENLTGRQCDLNEPEPTGCICQTEQISYSRKILVGTETRTRVFFCEFAGFDDLGIIYAWGSRCCSSWDTHCFITEFSTCPPSARNTKSDVDTICPTRNIFQTVTLTRSEDRFTCNDPNFGLDLDCDFCLFARIFLNAINNLHLTLTNRLNEVIAGIDKVAVSLAQALNNFSSNGTLNNYFTTSTQILICPLEFYNSEQNFVFHISKAFQGRFPFDLMGTIPSSFPQIAELELAFGVKIEAEPILSKISILRFPVLVGFLVYSLVKL